MTLSSRQSLDTSATTEMVMFSEASLSQVKENMEGIKIDPALFYASTCQQIKELNSGINRLLNMSTDQSDTLRTIVPQLQDLIATEAYNKFQGNRIHELPERSVSGTEDNHTASTEYTREDPEEELVASLKRLYSLAADIEKTFFAREAQDIIDDVEQLLDAISSIVETRSGTGNGRIRNLNHTYCRDIEAPKEESSESKRGFKQIKGFLATSQCITVNSKGVY